MQAIAQLQSASAAQQPAIASSAPMDIFQHLALDLDTEGRYLFLNAIANQLRYPNNHTHYFSCVLLYLFAEANQANQEIIQEQITRVLLERLIVNRPHPWGLLITFIELIKNPRYNFWSHSFTRCAPEIERLFESVARSCMGATHPKERDRSGSMDK
jgi:CCR4-NOT transcription complex subunit 1